MSNSWAERLRELANRLDEVSKDFVGAEWGDQLERLISVLEYHIEDAES
jgi:hypothetical protein